MPIDFKKRLAQVKCKRALQPFIDDVKAARGFQRAIPESVLLNINPEWDQYIKPILKKEGLRETNLGHWTVK